MKRSNLRDAAELIGITAIVASLVFVGLELRQQQEITLAAQYQERLRTGFDYFLQISQESIWQERMAEELRARFDPTDLSEPDRDLLQNGTPQDIGDWFIAAEINLLIYDNLYFQYESGFSTEESWLNQRERLRWVLERNSFARQQVKLSSSRYRPSFVAVANILIEEIEAADN